jgi:hypothetical protein
VIPSLGCQVQSDNVLHHSWVVTSKVHHHNQPISSRFRPNLRQDLDNWANCLQTSNSMQPRLTWYQILGQRMAIAVGFP